MHVHVDTNLCILIHVFKRIRITGAKGRRKTEKENRLVLLGVASNQKENSNN